MCCLGHHHHLFVGRLSLCKCIRIDGPWFTSHYVSGYSSFSVCTSISQGPRRSPCLRSIPFISSCDNRRIKNLGIHCLALWAIAVTIWICDRMFCSFWLSISFPYLHSIWHVLILFSGNEAIVVSAYLIIKQQYPNANLVLHLWPSENWRCLALPYLKFHDDEDTDYLMGPSNGFDEKFIV